MNRDSRIPEENTIDEWLERFETEAREYASHHLRFDPRAATPRADPGAAQGAVYVAVLSDRTSIHLGLSTSRQACGTLARALLGARQSQDLSEAEIIDGMSEILNILAGKVKSKMSDSNGRYRLGLPIFVDGQAAVGAAMERAVSTLTLGPVTCQLMVFRTRVAT